METAVRLRMRANHRRRAIRKHRVTLLELRNVSSPFDLPEIRFQKLFRLSKFSVRWIIEKLEIHAIPSTIPFEIQVLTALHFYGHGSYQVSIGSNHLLALSQPSVSRSITTVTQLINNHLLDELIKFPHTILQRVETKERFLTKYGMSGVIGAIDGCHIAIVGPSENDEYFRSNVYRNRKGFHSINTLVCCDSKMYINYADARFPGSVHDSAIWITSPLRKHFQKIFTTVQQQNTFLIGDSGFPLEPWLLTPFSSTIEGTREYLYNEKFIRTRNIIEKCFGVVKSRFRCLSRQRVLYYDPVKAGLIIYAVFCMHNICINDENNLLEIDDEGPGDSEVEHDPESSSESNVLVRQWHTLGSQVRQKYIENQFNN